MNSFWRKNLIFRSSLNSNARKKIKFLKCPSSALYGHIGGYLFSTNQGQETTKKVWKNKTWQKKKKIHSFAQRFFFVFMWFSYFLAWIYQWKQAEIVNKFTENNNNENIYQRQTILFSDWWLVYNSFHSLPSGHMAFGQRRIFVHVTLWRYIEAGSSSMIPRLKSVSKSEVMVI